MKVLVVYDSESGNTEAMAHAVSEGVESEGVDVEVKRVEEASIDALPMVDGASLGSPVYYGLPTAKIKRYIDESGGCYGLEKSLEYLEKIGMSAVERRVLELSKYLWSRLDELSKEMYTPQGTKSPIVSFHQHDASGLARRLMTEKVKVTGRPTITTSEFHLTSTTLKRI